MTVEASPPLRRSARSRVWRWLRHGLVIFLALLLVEFLVVPKLVGASKDLSVLGRLNVAWLIAGIVLEAGAFASYAFLTRALLPKGGPSAFTLVRITMATTAVSHVLPGGAAGGAGLGYRLLTANGVEGADAAFALGSQAMGSAIVLNVLLWFSLVISIPLAGLHPIYVVVALLGLLGLFLAAALVYTVTIGERRSVRMVRAIGGHIPRLGADRFERIVHQVGDSVRALASDRAVLRRALFWASCNWLLDAASLWAFVASLGRYVDPVELFAAYGIANVLAVIPITPGGLGIVEATLGALLVSFGVPRTIATFGVLGWRAVNFWLPIPVGGGTYVSLRVPRGSGLRANRQALAEMTTDARRPIEEHGTETRPGAS